MGHSIQEILKNINSKLSKGDLTSLGAATVFLIGFSVFLEAKQESSLAPVQYMQGKESPTQISEQKPFGSKNGATYTFSWCQNASAIKQENKIYFENSEAAERTGRRLSKLCEK